MSLSNWRWRSLSTLSVSYGIFWDASSPKILHRTSKACVASRTTKELYSMFRVMMLNASKTSSITSKVVKSLTSSALVLPHSLNLRKMVVLPVTVVKANNGVVLLKADTVVELRVATETKVGMDNSVGVTDNRTPTVAANNNMVVDNQAMLWDPMMVVNSIIKTSHSPQEAVLTNLAQCLWAIWVRWTLEAHKTYWTLWEWIPSMWEYWLMSKVSPKEPHSWTSEVLKTTREHWNLMGKRHPTAQDA